MGVNVHGAMQQRLSLTTAQFHLTKPELMFCSGSSPACGLSEIRDGEDLWHWSRLEIRLSTFRWPIIPQNYSSSSTNKDMARRLKQTLIKTTISIIFKILNGKCCLSIQRQLLLVNNFETFFTRVIIISEDKYLSLRIWSYLLKKCLMKYYIFLCSERQQFNRISALSL